MDDKFLPRGAGDMHGSPKPPWTPSLEERKARLRCMPLSLAEPRQGLLPCTRPALEPVTGTSISHKQDLAQTHEQKDGSGLRLGSLLVSSSLTFLI